MKEIKGDFDRLQISLCGNFPQGQRESIARLRIQTAAKGVNDFVKAMRLLAGSLDIGIKRGKSPIKRLSRDGPYLLSSN
jgi:hypothetical protein